jgi:hypothetical protein
MFEVMFREWVVYPTMWKGGAINILAPYSSTAVARCVRGLMNRCGSSVTMCKL